MVYQTLAEKIQDILESTRLKKPERALLLQAYLNPGVVMGCMEDEPTRRIISELEEKKIILREKERGKSLLYPMPISLLFQKFVDLRKPQKVEPKETLKSLDQWMKYPLLRKNDLRLKSTQDNKTVLEWIFEIHSSDWKRVFCFGDYESFIDAIGIDTEQDWIKERTKRNRCASVIATQDGKWAQHIRKVSKQELRDCLIDPKDFTDMFIMAFPDIHTTVIGSSEKEVTFIHSSTVSNTYAEMVERSLEN
jgi:hypothetical protein